MPDHADAPMPPQAATPPAQARFERQRKIRFSDCDPAGIVFYPQYFVMFNGLVEDWVDECLGLSYADLIGPRRVGLPTVSLQVDFRAISRVGELVTLGLAVDRLGSRSLQLALDCTLASERRVQIRQVLVTTDLGTHRAIAVPDDLRTAIHHFQGGC